MSGRIGSALGRGPNIKYWTLQHSPADRGGWYVPQFEHGIAEVDKLDEPLDEDDVRNTAEAEDWPPGHYRMIGRKDNGAVWGPKWTFERTAEEVESHTPEKELTEQEKIDRAVEQALRRADAGRPDTLEAKLMETMGKYEEGDIDEETVGGAIAMYRDVSSLIRQQDADILDRIAERKMDEGDLDAAARYEFAKRASERGGGGGGLLDRVAEGNLELDEAVGLQEVMMLDAYQRFGPKVDELLDAQTDLFGAGDNEDVMAVLGETAGADAADQAEAAAEATEAADADDVTSAEPDDDVAPILRGEPEDAAADEAAADAPSEAAEPEADREPVEDSAPDEEPPAAVESDDVEADAAADGGEGGVEALDEQVDTEAGQYPSLADAGEAIQDEADDEEGDE